jgi:hypothetical protein
MAQPQAKLLITFTIAGIPRLCFDCQTPFAQPNPRAESSFLLAPDGIMPCSQNEARMRDQPQAGHTPQNPGPSLTTVAVANYHRLRVKDR